MVETIRMLQREEWDDYHRFLERCFGHGYGAFLRFSPDRYRNDDTSNAGLLVLEADGKIASHVGIFEMEVVVGPARALCGGIGGVATLPEARGRNYMTQLMEEAVATMRRWGWPLSVLWGDQQRYSTFGYETCGVMYSIGVNRRSLGWAAVEPAQAEELDPRDPATVALVAGLQPLRTCRVERPWLHLQLLRPSVRIFAGPDGCVISRNEYSGDLGGVEVVSPTGREAELLLGAMNLTFAGGAEIEAGPMATPWLRRLIGSMSWWRARPQGMFRVVDWPLLARSLAPCLEDRARELGLPAFATRVGCEWQGETESVVVEWDGEALQVGDNAGPADAVLPARELAARLLGGPQPATPCLGLLDALLPVPLHIPGLDHI